MGREPGHLGGRVAGAHRAAHAGRVRELGFDDDAALASAIGAGDLDAEWETVPGVLAASARGQLLVANPDYLPPRTGLTSPGR